MKEAEQMNPNNTYSDNEIDLGELFQVLWEGRKLIILITVIVAITSVMYSLSLNNYYQSSSIMSVRSDTQNQGIASKMSGAASLLGVNFSSSGENKAMEVIALIQSRKFVKHLLTFENILPSIMAAKSYDTNSKKLILEPIYDSETKKWEKKPSYLKTYTEYMGGLVSISQDKKTGFILINVEHVSPIFAKEFLELIIQEANVLLRNKDMEESSKALEYLKFELSKTSFVEIRESINSLIKSQLEIQMVAKINENYMLVEIEPPFIPELKSKPSRSQIVILATLLGGLLSMFIVLVRNYISDNKQ